MAFNVSQKLAGNIAAIRIALDFNGQVLSEDEVSVLRQYAGFGGIKAVLFPADDLGSWEKMGASEADLKLYPQMLELHVLLREKLGPDGYEQAVDALKNNVQTAFYTPDFVPEMIYWALRENGITPRRLYEPSAGAGIFITEAVKTFPGVHIQAVEKDLVTAKVLTALCAGLGISAEIQARGLEETPAAEKGGSDLIISNIPFGNFSVFDPAFAGSGVTAKIHNYFFAKGLDKLADGGILAYLVTEGFLNSPSNETARKYLVTSADLLSVSVLPANLMKENAGVEVGTHLLIFQKNDHKRMLSEAEHLLTGTVEQENAYGKYYFNAYIASRDGLDLGDEVFEGTNAYGKAARVLWQTGEMLQIAGPLMGQVDQGLAAFDHQRWKRITFPEQQAIGKPLTFLPVPIAEKGLTTGQLGLFDTALSNEQENRAQAYLDDLDKALIDAASARVISTVRTTARPAHDSILLLTARAVSTGRYLYKLCSNLGELSFPKKWLSGIALGQELDSLSVKLRYFSYDYRYEGDMSLEPAFKLMADRPAAFRDLRPFYEKGTLALMDGRAGLLGEISFGSAEFKPLDGKAGLEFYQAYVPLRDVYFTLSTLEAREQVAYPELRRTLNELYDALTEIHGPLNKPANRNLVLADAAFGFKILSSLEISEQGEFIRSGIFSGPLFHVATELLTDDPAEALARCLNDVGRVDISHIGRMMGLAEEEAIRALEHLIVLNPGTLIWETTDQYLSGNVVEKLKTAEAASTEDPENFQLLRSLHAIKRVQPERIPFELLDFNLGERWVPTEFYERFASDLFKLDTSVSYFASVDVFKVHYRSGNTVTDEEFAVFPKASDVLRGNRLLEYALENTSPNITYPEEVNGEIVRVPDTEAIQDAHRKIEAIRSRYIDWLRGLSTGDKALLEKRYNDTFNCYVLREYDGAHLRFPGLDKKALGIDDLYSSQKNAAWRIIQNRGALVDHEVGLGKTLTMIVAAMEMKRLGIVAKPMIIALKANVAQIRDTFRLAYPEARILAPGENDYTPAKRQRLFHQIKNNNWDCVILTHDQFGMIPQSPEIQRQIFEAEQDNIERDLQTFGASGARVGKAILKGLEVRKNNLDVKLNTLTHAIETRKDTGINFQEMNIDHLFVDESHKFKNLTFTTRHNRVAGLGNQAGSQKALNMLFAIRSLQDKFDSDLCVTFLSGTPISNSLTEMYLIFKYLRPKELERQQISNFDAWAAVFARKTVDFEFTVTNEIRAKERFRYFIKVPELALFYNEITDYKTAKHINLDKPEIDETLVNIPPTAAQEDFIKRLMVFARTGDAKLIGRQPLTKEEDMGRMLIATNYAKKMAVDMRLVNENRYGDDPGNKVSVCARNVAAIYRESHENKGTQIIFCDIGTPKPQGFNIYDALLGKLVTDHDIPIEEINFIHHWTDRQKPELFRKMNTGLIRVLIGSTDKAGTGLNVQERIVAMHHMDVPWKPSELEQRDGRGARQGNWLAKLFFNNKVRNFIYAVERSLDNYKFGLLRNKQTFISQMKNSELSVRTLDEGAMDEQSGANFAEYIAVLSGDTSLLDKARLEKKVAELESYRTSHYKDTARSRYKLEQVEKKLEGLSGTYEKLAADDRRYREALKLDTDGTKLNPVKLLSGEEHDAVSLGQYFIGLYRDHKPATGGPPERLIGSLYGFDLYVERQGSLVEKDGRMEYEWRSTLYAESPETGIKYRQNNGAPTLDNPKLAARYFLNAIDRASAFTEKTKKEIAELEVQIPALSELTGKIFDREEELVGMKQELAELEVQIARSIQEKQADPGVFEFFDDEDEEPDIDYNSGPKR